MTTKAPRKPLTSPFRYLYSAGTNYLRITTSTTSCYYHLTTTTTTFLPFNPLTYLPTYLPYPPNLLTYFLLLTSSSSPNYAHIVGLVSSVSRIVICDCIILLISVFERGLYSSSFAIDGSLVTECEAVVRHQACCSNHDNR